jgi:hypothetical protein
MTSEPLITDPLDRAISLSTGRAPKDGWAALVPELDVSNIQESLSFWCDPLGFDVAYDRPAARFSYLVKGWLQILRAEWALGVGHNAAPVWTRYQSSDDG